MQAGIVPHFPPLYFMKLEELKQAEKLDILKEQVNKNLPLGKTELGKTWGKPGETAKFAQNF